MEYMPFVALVPWTIVFQAANLLILAALLRRFLLAPVRSILEKRRAEVVSLYENAGRELESAEKLRVHWEAQKSSAAGEIRQLKERAQNEADMLIVRSREAAKRETEVMEREAAERIRQREREARSALQKEMSAIAAQAAGRILRREVGEADQMRMLEAFLKDEAGE